MEHAQNMPFGRGLTPAQAEVLTPANRVGRFPVVAAPERGEPLWPRFDDQVLRSSCASWFLVVACLLLEQVGEQGRSTGGAVGGD